MQELSIHALETELFIWHMHVNIYRYNIVGLGIQRVPGFRTGLWHYQLAPDLCHVDPILFSDS